MKFGIYSSIASPPRGDDLDRCVDQVIAEAQLAEASGFDSCFFGEHHQDKDGFLPSPLIVATAVAAQTRTLNVGTSVILLALHHPVRIAEDVTTLDIVSKGRIILGVGVGYQPADFRAFGVPIESRAARFEEGVELQMLAGEPFSLSWRSLSARRLHPPATATRAPLVDRRERAIRSAASGALGRCLCLDPQYHAGRHGAHGRDLSAGSGGGRTDAKSGPDAGRLGGVKLG